MKKWTKEEEQFLRDNQDISSEDVARELNRSRISVQHKSTRLGLKKDPAWSEDDVNYLIANYESFPYKKIANKINKTERSVAAKANSLGLRRTYGWSQYEIDILTVYCKSHTYEEIGGMIGRSTGAVSSQIRKLGLSKTKMVYNTKFFDKMSHKLSYFLGFHLADGCITKDHKLRIAIHPKDVEVLRYFRDWIGGSIVFYNSYSKFHKRNKYSYIYGAYCKEICDKLLYEYNIPQQKTGNEVIPKQVTKEFMPSLIRGYFDGDGSLSLNESLRARICCANREFLEKIVNFLGFGKIISCSGIYRLYFDGDNASQFCDIIYNEEEFCLYRKKWIYLNYDPFSRKRRPFSKHDVEFITLNYPTMDVIEMADCLGRSVGCIRIKIKELGLAGKS